MVIDTPKAWESNFIHHDFVPYNSENNIRDVPYGLFVVHCHFSHYSSVVKYASSLSMTVVSYSSEAVMSFDYQLLLKSPPLTLLAKSAPALILFLWLFQQRQ